MPCVCRHTYQLSMRFNYINSMMQRINRAVGDAVEMTRILDEPRLVEDEPGARPLEVREGAIDFSHLSFRYLDAAEGDYVFEDLDLHVPAGRRVGLVGRSGSGKTTLTKLLLRLSDVQGGRVLVDGQDVSRCTQQSLRQQIAYVPQEALENLMRGRTSLVVAHRLSTVASLYRIVVLEGGAVVEDGTHQEFSQAGGVYESLWDRQTGAFLEGE